MDRRPWILLDFDGVLNIADWAPEAPPGWRAGSAFLDCGPERVVCSPLHGSWLAALARETGARLAWATMREQVASFRCAPLAGLPRKMPVVPVLEAMSYGGAVTKAESVVPWTDGAPFVWFEDLATECLEADALAAGQPHLMIEVDSRYGLTQEHVEEARKWLLELREV